MQLIVLVVSCIGTFEEYEVPYLTKLCSPHPTRHDLITLVCHQHYRPEVSFRLYTHSPVGLTRTAIYIVY